MTISILIPAHNEELSIAACVRSCLNQTRKVDQILFVNDGSGDDTAEILASFGDSVQVVTIPRATGNKSRAQEIGLKHVTGDIVVMSDADSILEEHFIERIVAPFEDEHVAAVAGHVQSMKHNWVTACRAIEYAVAQYVHKVAQDYLGYIFVLPGAGVAFRMSVLMTIPFLHRTICEDLELTYILHERGLSMKYIPNAVVYTADPSTVESYIGQVRRWHIGGAECLKSHWRILFTNPRAALELSLSYVSTALGAMLLIGLPLVSLRFFLFYVGVPIILFAFICSAFAAIAERRPSLILYFIPFISIIIINNYIIVESLIKVFFGGHKTSKVWYSPTRYLSDKKIAS